jgi:hypothetical protein
MPSSALQTLAGRSRGISGMVGDLPDAERTPAKKLRDAHLAEEEGFEPPSESPR